MDITEAIKAIKTNTSEYEYTLVAVSKTKPSEMIQDAYDGGHKVFGENKVQELVEKYEQLPKDIEWHMIGHLQRNKVKFIAPFVSLIHAVDSPRLLKEIDKQAQRANRKIDCLLQVHIAKEETKFGFDYDELEEYLATSEFKNLNNIRVYGLMGMATNTSNEEIVHSEFAGLKAFFEKLKSSSDLSENVELQHLSMGMSGDYKIALEEGSTMVRIGSSIFGARN